MSEGIVSDVAAQKIIKFLTLLAGELLVRYRRGHKTFGVLLSFTLELVNVSK